MSASTLLIRHGMEKVTPLSTKICERQSAFILAGPLGLAYDSPHDQIGDVPDSCGVGRFRPERPT
jgi:hypothetical protein